MKELYIRLHTFLFLAMAAKSSDKNVYVTFRSSLILVLMKLPIRMPVFP